MLNSFIPKHSHPLQASNFMLFMLTQMQQVNANTYACNIPMQDANNPRLVLIKNSTKTSLFLVSNRSNASQKTLFHLRYNAYANASKTKQSLCC